MSSFIRQDVQLIVIVSLFCILSTSIFVQSDIISSKITMMAMVIVKYNVGTHRNLYQTNTVVVDLRLPVAEPTGVMAAAMVM